MQDRELQYPKEMAYVESEVREFTHESTNSVGSNGLVLFGHHRKLNIKVAIKIYDHDENQTNQEPELLCSLDNNHIIKVFDARQISNSTSLYMMPFANNGNLIDYLQKVQIDINQSFRFTFELLSAISYLHSVGLVHRDLKPENILINDGSLLIGDFGSVCRLDLVTGKAPASKHSILFRPPEAFGNSTFFDKSSDLYQIGLIAYVLFGFQYNTCLLDYLSEKERTSFNSNNAINKNHNQNSEFIDDCIKSKIIQQKLFNSKKLPWYLTPKTKAVLRKSNRTHGKRYSTPSEFMTALQNAQTVAPNWSKTESGFHLKCWGKADYNLDCKGNQYLLSKKVRNGKYRTIDKYIAELNTDLYKYYRNILELP